MSKFLFDPVYSAVPRRCSSAFKYKMLAEALLKHDPNHFILWHVPEGMSDEDKAWLPQDPRIAYREVPYEPTNRLHDYTVLNDKVIKDVWLHGPAWDWDMLVTMRTCQIGGFRLLAIGPRSDTKVPHKTIVLLEEMLVVSARKGISQPHVAAQDRLTIGGMMDADSVFVTVKHVREMALAAARDNFPPSQVIALAKKIKLICPVDLPPLLDKRDGFMPKAGEKPVLLFSGRANASSSRLGKIFHVMTADYAMGGDAPRPVRFSSVSDAIKESIPAHIVPEKNDRDAFWTMLKEQVHLGIYMAQDADFSLTVLEPICFGVPMIVAREAWSKGLLGKDYPFFVKSETEALGMLKAFSDDYAAMYETFIAWRKARFEPAFLDPAGDYGTRLVDCFLAEVEQQDRAIRDAEIRDSDMSRMLAKVAKPGETVSMFTLMERTEDAGLTNTTIRHFDQVWSKPNVSSSFKLDFAALRHRLKVLTGATDAGHEPGLLTFPVKEDV